MYRTENRSNESKIESDVRIEQYWYFDESFQLYLQKVASSGGTTNLSTNLLCLSRLLQQRRKEGIAVVIFGDVIGDAKAHTHTHYLFCNWFQPTVFVEPYDILPDLRPIPCRLPWSTRHNLHWAPNLNCNIFM